jgi:hypothetical protein
VALLINSLGQKADVALLKGSDVVLLLNCLGQKGRYVALLYNS